MRRFLAGLVGRIPSTMLLQPADLSDGALPHPVADPLPPEPRVEAPLPRPHARRTVTAYYRRYLVSEYVARYRRDGARVYLNAWKEHLSAGHDDGFVRYADDHLGPDTVLFVRKYAEGRRQSAYVAAAVGRYVVVVLVADPIVGAGDPTTANDLAQRAMRRIAPPA